VQTFEHLSAGAPQSFAYGLELDTDRTAELACGKVAVL
jgi:hypothetical protein